MYKDENGRGRSLARKGDSIAVKGSRGIRVI